jgi:hypothetical protein
VWIITKKRKTFTKQLDLARVRVEEPRGVVNHGLYRGSPAISRRSTMRRTDEAAGDSLVSVPPLSSGNTSRRRSSRFV